MSLGDQTTKQEMAIPGWLEKGAKNTFKSAQKFYDKDYKAYKGERVADFNPAQNSAFNAISTWAAPGGGASEALGLTREAATAGPTELTDYGRIVDENGKLGAISDYINPYVGNAINPAIRDIERASAAKRMRIGDMAARAGAFGDARHGVLEGTVNRNNNEAVGDLSYKAYSDAYNQAMAARTGDLSRWTGRDLNQAQLNETGWNRQLSGSQQMMEQGLAGPMAQLQVGNLQQQNAQSRLDTDYEAYQRKMQDQYDKLAALVGAVGGVPYSRTQTTTQPDNSWAQLVGAGVGALIPG